jgi:hypothetical protein
MSGREHPCFCGHAPEEHGGDPVHPAWDGCNELIGVDHNGDEMQCPCDAYDPDPDDEEEPPVGHPAPPWREG